MPHSSRLPLLLLLATTGAGAHAAEVTWQATGTFTSVPATPSLLPNAGVGVPFTFTFTFDPDAAPATATAITDQALYSSDRASTLQVGNRILSLSPAAPGHGTLQVTNREGPASAFASDAFVVETQQAIVNGGGVHYRATLSLDEGASPAAQGPFDSTGLPRSPTALAQFSNRTFDLALAGSTLHGSVSEISVVPVRPDAFTSAEVLVNDAVSADEVTQAYQFVATKSGTLQSVVAHLFRFPADSDTSAYVSLAANAADDSGPGAALEGFHTNLPFFSGQSFADDGYPPALILKSQQKPVLVAGTKYWLSVASPQPAWWRKAELPLREYYLNPSPLIKRDGIVSRAGAFTIKIDAFPEPVVQNDSAVVAVNASVSIDVLANDAAASGQTLDPGTVQLASSPQHGTASVNPGNGVVLYEPTAGFTGDDSFGYTVRDGVAALSSVAAVSIRVQPAPVAANDSGTLSTGQNVTLDVLANDQSNGGTLDAASLVVVGTALHGSTVIANGKIGYTPQAGYSGTDALQYLVRDNLGTASNLATVSLTIRALPVAANDASTVRAGEAVTIDVLANDTSAGGTIDAASIAISSAPSHGTATIAGTRITYSAASGYAGPDTFQYTVKDDRGAQSNAATVSVDVTTPPPIGGGATPPSSGGGGGGGAIDLAELLALVGLAGLALRRRSRQAA